MKRLRQQPAAAVAALVITFAAVSALGLLFVSSPARPDRPAVLLGAADRGLLNPLSMMKQLAAIKKLTQPPAVERIPTRDVLEAEVLARQGPSSRQALEQSAARSHESKPAIAHESKPARSAVQSPTTTLSKYEEQSRSLAAQARSDGEMASELSAKAKDLAAEAKKQERLSRIANAKGERLIDQAKASGQNLKKQAQIEDKEASRLVSYAKKMAQRMVKKEALDEMKKWMAAHDAQNTGQRRHESGKQLLHGANKLRGRRNTAVLKRQAHARGQAKVPLTALTARRTEPLRGRSAARSAPEHETEGDHIRSEFKQWRTSQLKAYATEHDLYTKSQFCNSRATAHSPSMAELERAFGPDWQSVPPRVASLAAVNGCMEALGLRARAASRTHVSLWNTGALKGKANDVVACAHGDNKACEVIAHSPGALRGLKHLIPW